MKRLSILALVMITLLDISRSSEVPQSSEKFLNHDTLNKKILPSVKHLLKDGSDGNKQKFLHLINEVQVEGYKSVDGKSPGEVHLTYS